MAQGSNINKYLVDDTIFNKINKRFISLDPDDMKENNQHLLAIFTKLIHAMRQQSPLFDKTFQRIAWAGSYYKGTRFGQPEEYDLNFVINLPIKEKDLEFSTDRPGFIKIHWTDRNSHNTLNIDPRAYRELKSFIDEQSYLNQEKFRTWMEGILSKVAHNTGGNNRIILDGYMPIRISKSGPAFTLIFQFVNPAKTIEIDVVPILVFSTRTKMPPRCSRRDILQFCSDRYWSVVPKPLNNIGGNFSDPRYRYWRLCFYEFEKDMLSNHNYGHIKLVIRQLKKFRNTQEWKSISSYYLETLCYHELEMFHISRRKSMTFLFFMMLERLYDAFCNHCITYYWDDESNLLENIGFDEMRNMKYRLNRILKDIRRTIEDDQYAIAKFVLYANELITLKVYVNTSSQTPERELEHEPEISLLTEMILLKSKM